MSRLVFLLLALLGTSGALAEKAQDAYRGQVEAWRQSRVERLQAPSGWLTLVGMHWLEEGANRVGSAADNDIVLPGWPAEIGTITLTAGKLSLQPQTDSLVLVDGQPAAAGELLADSSGKPNLLTFETRSFFVIERGGRYALRVKDSEAATRKNFVGIDSFDIDPSWRVEADWIAHDPPKTIDIATVINTLEPMKNTGQARFNRDGKTYVLEAIEEDGAEELFFIFADRTSGRETYGPGRFLYAPKAQDGKIVLDFNRAYNPPCAFNAYSTCPLPPPENRLNLRVTAGEKKYRGALH